MKIVSSCLIGVNCKYNGKNNLNSKILNEFKKGQMIPVCPEQLGGLATLRVPAEIVRKKAITREGKDVTEEFTKGAEETLNIAKISGAKEAILKQNSPSCGCGKIYDGTFSGKLVNGDGLTTALLKKNGIKVISDEEF